MTAAVLTPAAVLGVHLDVSPDYTDAVNEQRIGEHARAQGMPAAEAALFAEDAAMSIMVFAFENCESCEKDLDRHVIGTGPFGEAHLFCLDCQECGHSSATLDEAFAHLSSHERGVN
jgi:hypothetical protein